MNHTLPKLPPVNNRQPIDLDASIARAIHSNFRQMALATAKLDAENAGADLLHRVTGQEFVVVLRVNPQHFGTSSTGDVDAPARGGRSP